jgi:hypothetical protein
MKPIGQSAWSLFSAPIYGQKEAFGPIFDQACKGADHSETLDTDVGASSSRRDEDGAVSGFVIFFSINVRVRHSTWGQNEFETVFSSNCCEQLPISFSHQPQDAGTVQSLFPYTSIITDRHCCIDIVRQDNPLLSVLEMELGGW